ncbi:hypothetical protein GJAV_G00106870 [Gymnothorax javanicus]|nr:hypothetical protein GJAV_G00106870 [Gymnothorax javanicus]
MVSFRLTFSVLENTHVCFKQNGKDKQRNETAATASIPMRTIRYPMGVYPHCLVFRVQTGGGSRHAGAHHSEFAVGLKI